MSLPWVEDPAVETAEEAKEPAEADINELCKDMFSKMATYLTGELTGKALQHWPASSSFFSLSFKEICCVVCLNCNYSDHIW